MTKESAVRLWAHLLNEFSVMAVSFYVTLEAKIIRLEGLLLMFFGKYKL